MNMIENIKEDIKKRCESPNNFFGLGSYEHIESVAKNAVELAKLCILNHRGSVVKEKTTKEEICVADADAISHYDTLPSLFYLAFVQRKLNINDGVEFVKNKLERSYNKMSQESKAYYKDKRMMIKSILK